jgi:GTP-binding protein HflX
MKKDDELANLDNQIDELINESIFLAAEYDQNEQREILDLEYKNQDLQDRQALRRVAGLSTELSDITDAEYRSLRLEKVVLIGVWVSGTIEDADNSLKELKELAQTAGSQVMDGLIQRREKTDPATYLGSGKVAELKEIVNRTGSDTVICDGELSPAQLRNLESLVKVKVIDRTALILDIFAQHAKSREGKAQVELAQMTYLLPRLRGWGENLSRQAGGIGGRGPGETKIETDRRRINDRMAKLRREIKEMKTARDIKRNERERNSIPAVAIAGYTNAGKSSLMNRFSGSDALVENALFATLDPLVRKMESHDGRNYTLTDTVGFVRHLPHQLIEAFKSTLEEVSFAQLILHVVDASNPNPRGQIEAVREVFAEINALEIPEIIAFNKVDAISNETLRQLLREFPNSYPVSARTGQGVMALKEVVEKSLPLPEVELKVMIPFTRGDLVALIHQSGEILSQSYEAEGTFLHVLVDGSLAYKLSPFTS